VVDDRPVGRLVAHLPHDRPQAIPPASGLPAAAGPRTCLPQRVPHAVGRRHAHRRRPGRAGRPRAARRLPQAAASPARRPAL
jgi:hypothetical protein